MRWESSIRVYLTIPIVVRGGCLSSLGWKLLWCTHVSAATSIIKDLKHQTTVCTDLHTQDINGDSFKPLVAAILTPLCTEMCHGTRGHNIWEKDNQLMFTKTTTRIHSTTAHLGSRLILYAVSLTASTMSLMQGAYLWWERFGFQMILTRSGPKWRLNRHAVHNKYATIIVEYQKGSEMRILSLVEWECHECSHKAPFSWRERLTTRHLEPYLVVSRWQSYRMHEIHTLEYQKLTVQNISWVQTAIEGMYQALFCRIFRRASFALNPHSVGIVVPRC